MCNNKKKKLAHAPAGGRLHPGWFEATKADLIHIISYQGTGWIRCEIMPLILINVLHITLQHWAPFFFPLMRQAHQESAGAFWYLRKGMVHKNINAHNSQQIKRDFVRREDHTNYQLFIVCYCCHSRSLIIFGGQHYCISSMWRIFPFSFLFLWKLFIWLCHISCYGVVPHNRLSR